MKGKLLLVSSLATVLAAMTAWAVPLNITVDQYGNLLNGPAGYATKSQYGQTGNSPTNDLNFLLQEIKGWNNKYDPDLGPAFGVANYEGLTGITSSYTALAGYDYVVLHWGNGGTGNPGGVYQAYYLGGQGGVITAPSGVGGLSSARYVPDGGSTVMLLGAVLSVIAVARRKYGV
jgi:VPDSG-CTERM motif